jgi:hypothetical protein
MIQGVTEQQHSASTVRAPLKGTAGPKCQNLCENIHFSFPVCVFPPLAVLQVLPKAASLFIWPTFTTH